MRTITTTAYKFAELSEEAQQKAIDNNREVPVDHDWWDCAFDDFKEVGRILGIEVDKIYFSGFSSQGDGACFTGTYSYAKGSAKAIREYAPKDTDLHGIADQLAAIQRRYFYSLYAYVEHSGRYCHSGCTDIDVREDYYEFNVPEEDIKQILREFMDWMYYRLEAEYDCLTSDDCIRETLTEYDYEFTEDGENI